MILNLIFISDANHPEFVYQLHGTVTDLLTAMTRQMKRIVGKLHVQTTSINVRTTNASSRRMFVTESINAEMDRMRVRNMLVQNLH